MSEQQEERKERKEREEYERRLDAATTFESFLAILEESDESDEWFYGQCEKALLLAGTVKETMELWEHQQLGSDLDTRVFAKALALSTTQDDLESILNTFFEIWDDGAKAVLHFKENIKLVLARMDELGIVYRDDREE